MDIFKCFFLLQIFPCFVSVYSMISQYNSDGLQTLLRLLNEANFGPSIFWSSRTTVDASWLEPVISMVFQILK